MNRYIEGKAAEAMYGAMVGKNAEGALVTGTKVIKIYAEPGDLHPLNTMGEVIGSMNVEVINKELGGLGVTYAYIVQFDNTEYPVFIIDKKIKEVV